jgi:hypothetical protein
MYPCAERSETGNPVVLVVRYERSDCFNERLRPPTTTQVVLDLRFDWNDVALLPRDQRRWRDLEESGDLPCAPVRSRRTVDPEELGLVDSTSLGLLRALSLLSSIVITASTTMGLGRLRILQLLPPLLTNLLGLVRVLVPPLNELAHRASLPK